MEKINAGVLFRLIVRFSETALNRISQRIAAWPMEVLIFGLLVIFFLKPELTTNEEQYFQLAKQFFNPDWIPGSETLTEFPGARVLYQYIIGFGLQFFAFENLRWIGTAVLAAGYAFVLARIYRVFNFNHFDALLHFAVLFLTRQSFFGGEWIFLGLEPKHFAYLFVFWALYKLLKGKELHALLLLVAASYFHVLVGGWTLLYVGIYLFFNSDLSWTKRIMNFFAAGILLLPFVFYLKTGLSAGDLSQELSHKVDWIYTYFRSPHHTAIFKDGKYFMDTHFSGVLMTLLAFLLLFLARPRMDAAEKQIKKLADLTLIIGAGLLVSVVLAFFDKHGSFVKYYPFRINALFVFCAWAVAFWGIKNWLFERFQPSFYNLAVLLTAVLLNGHTIAMNLNANVKHFFAPKKDLETVAKFIRENTPPDSKILFLGSEMDCDLSLTRKMQRDNFVVYKFTPAGTSTVLNWYDRVQEREQISKQFEHVFETRKKYRIDYLMSEQKIASDSISLIFNNDKYYIYLFR